MFSVSLLVFYFLFVMFFVFLFHCFFFFFNDTATTEIYTLSLHDALPIASTLLAMPPRPTVYPSGGAFATASAPSTPPAPARFSTTNDCPDSSLIFWQRMRESVSVAPPAGKPLTYFTARVGQASCAATTFGSNGAAID